MARLSIDRLVAGLAKHLLNWKGSDMKKMQIYGKLIATLYDGKEIKVAVYKAGRTVELRFLHPSSGRPISVLAYPSNQDTVEGWMHEIGVQCGPSVSVVEIDNKVPWVYYS